VTGQYQHNDSSLLKHTVKHSPFQIIEDQLRQVKELIAENLANCDELVRPLTDYFGESSGKMLRPGLVLLSGKACGEITEEHVKIAAIVEMIHNATLLHDDVVDEGQKRRGTDTVNKIWGNESAVLLGDFLLSRVFGMCTNLEPKIISTIAVAAVQTCEGELKQVMQRRNRQLNEQQYIEIITEKTAALFSGCCRLGGLISGAEDRYVHCLQDYGLNLGIAFQIIDDLLDIDGPETETGKTNGRDIEKNKLTLPLIHLLNNSAPAARADLESKLNEKSLMAEELKTILTKSGSLKYVHSRAVDFADKATASLAPIPPGQARSALAETADFIVSKSPL